MKNIMIIKNSIYNTFRVLTHKTTILFIITVLLISCNGTEEICNDKNIDYLDIEFQDTRKFTSTELNIIYAAIQRIEKHASFDRCILFCILSVQGCRCYGCVCSACF